MGTRRSDEQNIRSLTKNSSGTYQISIPIGQIRKLHWQTGQRLVVTKRGNKLVVEDWTQ